jgi:hypothetical protein
MQVHLVSLMYEGRLKVRELAAVCRCYAGGGGDCYAKL